MLRRTSEQSSINFLNQTEDTTTPVDSNKKESMSLSELSEQQKSKALNNKDDGYMNINHIRSAAAGDITDMGGPQKQIKTDISPSIWNNDKLLQMEKELDNKEKTKIAKNKIHDVEVVKETNRRTSNLAEAMQNYLQEKSPQRLPDRDGSNYKSSKNHMSIFDSKDFENLPQQTDGEKLAESNKNKANEKDNSWKNSGKSKNAQDVVSTMFDNLMNHGDK